ncbi:MCE family protein [Mycolicibacterium vanbaalenii]|uniref:MCE family protein n=1 Tax=Mycolicibacterium vanbaalenii TaxID=110539 RepID=UPI001F2483BD|nr:MCE family protein [Mycolicibacterium vanbaalenii]
MLVLVLGGAASFIAFRTWMGPTTVFAYFKTAMSIYPGDDVRVSGMKVGTITAIDPDGTQTRLTLDVQRRVPIPADAKAVLVAPNLVAARYIQLTPAYRTSGPIMVDGAVIPVERTAVPVEWDQVKEQLTRLATELGPNKNVSTPALSQFIDSTANALEGNGNKLRNTLSQLAGLATILSDGSGDIVTTIEGLQTLVTALRDSKQQIVQFQDHMATLSSVLNGSRSDLDAALTNLSTAIVELKRFVTETGEKTSEQIQRLANVTQTLSDQRMVVEQILHVAPTALVNTYNMFDPKTGAPAGQFVVNNFSDTNAFFCNMIAALSNVTAPETGKLCAQYLGPALDQMTANTLPIPFNPLLMARPPWQSLIYSEDRLKPGGDGPKPQTSDLPPAVSAYTGEPADVPEPHMPVPTPDPEGGPPPPAGELPAERPIP